MRALQDRTQETTMVAFDRTSTREELFEVIDLLCNNGKSEFTRSSDVAGRGSRSYSELSALSDAVSQVANEDTDVTANGEIRSLEDLLMGQTERLN